MPTQTNNTPNKRGPRTPEGRQRSSRNAIRHGLTAAQVVLDYESPEQYEALKQAVFAELQPETEIERQLTADLVNHRWRLDRIVRIETSTFDNKMEDMEGWFRRYCAGISNDARIAHVFESLAKGPALALLDRYETRLRRAYERTLRTLLQLQAERRAQQAAAESTASEHPGPPQEILPNEKNGDGPDGPPPMENGASGPYRLVFGPQIRTLSSPPVAPDADRADSTPVRTSEP
ncbi:MAG: hypothetical protein ACK5AZ_05390 [Bryobacteraceae bacterium]